MRDLAGFMNWLSERGRTPATVIDVGVCHGTPALQDGAPEAYHILIEPLAEMEPRLAAILRRRRGEYHLTALGARAGRARMKVEPGAPEGASLAGTESIPPDDPRLREVPVTTLSRLLGARDLARPILLKTDCQGHDLEVLKGAGRALRRRLDMVVMEANLFRPAADPGRAHLGDIVAAMRRWGFDVADILSYQTRPRDGALGYVDLAFLRADGPLRADHRWA